MSVDDRRTALRNGAHIQWRGLYIATGCQEVQNVQSLFTFSVVYTTHDCFMSTCMCYVHIGNI